MENPLSRILSIIAFFIIGVIVVWGAFNLARLAAPSLASFFDRVTGRNAGITVSLSETSVESGTPVDISWKYRTSEQGRFAFVYPCKDGVAIKAVNSDDTSAPIACGTAAVTPENTKARIIPTNAGTEKIDVPLTIVFLPSATSSHPTEGGATLTIAPASEGGTQALAPAEIKTTAPTKTPSKSTSGSAASHTPTGKPDLKVTILSIGIIDPYTNDFSNVYPTSPEQTAAVRIRVTNEGGSATGAWHFTADLPTTPTTPYRSPTQKSLAPGYSGEYILRFGPVCAGGGTFIVHVDPTNDVRESDESDNTASATIPMPYYGY